jgi:hypothetical protein
MAMTPSPTAVDVSVGPSARYVDWTAIIAGAILATAISFVLFTFGTAIGLSLTSPYPGESVNITAFAVALGLWVLWVTVSSLMAGAYLTGRLRRRIGDATEHEVEVRDAAHGLLVWAVSVLIGAFIAAWVASGVASKATDVAAGAAAGAAEAVAEQVDLADYWTDVLLQPAPSASGTATATAETTTAPAPSTTTGAQTAPSAPAAPATTSAPSASPAAASNTEQSRQTAQRIMSSRTTNGQLSPEDRSYLTRIVRDTTGLNETDAAARVDATLTGLTQARAKAQEMAEKARKFGILVAFLTAASLAVGAAAAWWAAIIGGRHRDQATDFGFFFGR